MHSNNAGAQVKKFPTTAIILAGGMGTRLRKVVVDRPKVLAPIAGRPFLHYLLSHLAGEGIQKVILSTGYLADQVRAFVGNGELWNLEVHYREELQPLGTGGALRFASQGLDGTFFALNGDTLFMVNLSELWRVHQEYASWGTLALRPIAHESKDWHQRGCVVLTKDKQIPSLVERHGKILSFDEKPQTIAQGKRQALINGGLYVLEPEALAGVPRNQAVSIERQIFPDLASQGRLAGYVQHKYFADIGTPESLMNFERDVQEGILTDEKIWIKKSSSSQNW